MIIQTQTAKSAAFGGRARGISTGRKPMPIVAILKRAHAGEPSIIQHTIHVIYQDREDKR